jgi:septum formation protein
MRLSKPLILASQSPRRVALLRQIGLAPRVIPSSIVEEFDFTTSPAQNAMRLAHAKALDVGKEVENAIIIGADTIVVLDNEYLGKPSDPSDAISMLERLSGKTHIVITGVAILDRPSDNSVTQYEETKVTFRPIPRKEIGGYVAEGSPLDKAGAYGIQDDYGAVFVSRIEGCYYNVVGLPLSRFHMMLQEFTSQLDEQ